MHLPAFLDMQMCWGCLQLHSGLRCISPAWPHVLCTPHVPPLLCSALLYPPSFPCLRCLAKWSSAAHLSVLCFSGQRKCFSFFDWLPRKTTWNCHRRGGVSGEGRRVPEWSENHLHTHTHSHTQSDFPMKNYLGMILKGLQDAHGRHD